MTTLTATDARKSLFDLLRGANERHEIYHIRHRQGDAVLMSEAEYESLIETLGLLSSPGFGESFKQAQTEAQTGDTRSFDEVFGEPQ
ncbi:type II toxin-antitoxin system Phd/YefM family antitoxin [uncultured Thiodictyon sp.]|uniref:type II toxin-antitoxin system Phd/YefM family antitoxin n=1 Tax=uncultured Thiodictyon sp. TaxID=1846217 RepID=UPI00345480BE